MKAPIFLWTGEGWGKTTSALGVCLRSLGQGKKVTIIQFMKGRKDIGEYRMAKKLPNLDIHQFGSKEWINLKHPSDADKKRAKKGLDFAKEAAMKKPFLLFLDEINLAVAVKLLDEHEVLDFLDQIPPEVHIYMTGRYATPKLINRADYVNKIVMVKGPKRLTGEKGIDY